MHVYIIRTNQINSIKFFIKLTTDGDSTFCAGLFLNGKEHCYLVKR